MQLILQQIVDRYSGQSVGPSGTATTTGAFGCSVKEQKMQPILLEVLDKSFQHGHWILNNSEGGNIFSRLLCVATLVLYQGVPLYCLCRITEFALTFELMNSHAFDLG